MFKEYRVSQNEQGVFRRSFSDGVYDILVFYSDNSIIGFEVESILDSTVELKFPGYMIEEKDAKECLLVMNGFNLDDDVKRYFVQKLQF